MTKSTDRMKKVIGETIRTLRKEKRMSQADLAEALGTVGKAAVSSWEVGRSAPDAETLDRIAEIFSTPVDQFYTGERISYYYYMYAPDAPEPDEDLKAIIRAYDTVNDEGKKYLRDAAAFALGREMFRS